MSPMSNRSRGAIAEAGAPPAMPPPLRTVHLRRSEPESGTETAAAAITVEGGEGVDLARVGRALGLDPATVRLNGYYLSRVYGGYVSLAVKWRALIDFFDARGLPAGAHPAAAVAVQGTPLPPSPEPRDRRSAKRKSGLETGNCSKRLQDNSSTLSKSGLDLLSDDITLGLKRRLRLDETTPSKKIKQHECSSETQQPVKFSCSFINGHRKRPRDEEIATSLSCKRVR
ncbi:uncharacterized protein LOC100844251 isoform X2 [Brachypodium distachyon]|uniref:Uncharacterized protein n=2 Tax=Brachypodium distachyon TaxID=15368 RepID=A0A0Q3GJA8_BRADI|nr:uncharacterized protein LOC100844251 isoform X2 [Brachypodium distachyon]KQK11216.1 hypothetical protein BRADI_2g58835v3 [Brachypodium distachyon]|eukprot:XP_014754308.1 uncharacterized protein LOC100844251 isoform X2 [Brachypodium distachyon]